MITEQQQNTTGTANNNNNNNTEQQQQQQRELLQFTLKLLMFAVQMRHWVRRVQFYSSFETKPVTLL